MAKTVTRYRNAAYALVDGLDQVLQDGQRLTVRGSEILELRNHITVIDAPRERCISLPRRNNNIFATIAETARVMGGRNDLTYLSHYLPRAGDFSDDGKTWRAGYGPRLRNWYGVDQFKEIRRLLLADPNTRRAVMAIFDPAVDTQGSKDIPCNNWLDWLIRDSRLNLTIALRSNDAIWGFSGINSFEWSVLQEMLACRVGAEVGDVTYLATSFHVYAHHEERAREIATAFPGKTWYDMGQAGPYFTTAWEDFDAMLDTWFAIEARLRTTPEDADDDVARFPDPLFGQFLALLQLYNGLKCGWDDTRVASYLSRLPENDLTASAYEFLSRTHPAALAVATGHSTIRKWLGAFPPATTPRLKQPGKRTEK